MALDVTGKIAVIYETSQKSATFKTREFVIEKSEDIGGRIITNFIKFQSTQDRTAMLDKVSIGDEVKVHFNLRGTKWEKDGRVSYITNLDAWRIESFVPSNGGGSAPAPSGNSSFDPTAVQTSSDAGADDLPF